jgi:hypothetical protein
MVAPVAQCRENGNLACIRQTSALQGPDEFHAGTAQERIGGFFLSDGKGNSRTLRSAQASGVGDALLYIQIAGFAGKRKGQVVARVFMCTINERVVRQFGQPMQRMVQLRDGSFEVFSAARTKHHIAAKQHMRRNEGDMIVKVPGDLDDIEYGVNRLKPQLVALT